MTKISKIFYIPKMLHQRLLKAAAKNTNGNYSKMVLTILKENVKDYE